MHQFRTPCSNRRRKGQFSTRPRGTIAVLDQTNAIFSLHNRAAGRGPYISYGRNLWTCLNRPELLPYAMISIRPTSKSNGSPDSTRHSPRLADKQRNTRSSGKTHTSMVEKYLTQRVQPRRRFLWNKLKCFSQTSLLMKIGVIAMQGTKTFQTHLRKRSQCHRHHQHSLNFKRHCTQGATGQRQAQMAFQTQYGSVAHASMLRSLTSYSEFGSRARCLRPGSARRFDFSTNQDNG